MIFDEYFYRLTGGKGIDGKDVIIEIDPFASAGNDSAAVFGLQQVGSDHSDYEAYESPKRQMDSSEFAKGDYVIESDLVIPKTNKAERQGEKPVVLVIDDDFPTLDILKIYLMRDYTYHAFTSAKEGILFLNDHIVDLILFDCNIHTTPSAKVVAMIRQFKHCKDVPIIYMGDEFELNSVRNEIPEGVKGTLKRPVSRGDLHEILNEYIINK